MIFVTNKEGLSINIYHCSVLGGVWRCQRQHLIKLLLVKSQVLKIIIIFFFLISKKEPDLSQLPEDREPLRSIDITEGVQFK